MPQFRNASLHTYRLPYPVSDVAHLFESAAAFKRVEQELVRLLLFTFISISQFCLKIPHLDVGLCLYSITSSGTCTIQYSVE